MRCVGGIPPGVFASAQADRGQEWLKREQKSDSLHGIRFYAIGAGRREKVVNTAAIDIQYKKVYPEVGYETVKMGK
jgi:hypothetical protein